MAADICYNLAQLYLDFLKDTEKAMLYHNEALQHDQTCKKAMIALCKIHISKSDYAAAQQVCTTMIRMDIGIDDATLMLAQIMFLTQSYTQSIFHFRQLLERDPCNFTALSQLLDMLRKSGNLNQAESFMELCVKASNEKCLSQPGFHYCKGTLFWFENNPNAALSELNLCRNDAEWGQMAISIMIEIFLNPDNETLGGQVLTGEDGGKPDDEKTDNEILALLTADKLLKVLAKKDNSPRMKCLEAYGIMATKQKRISNAPLRSFWKF